jgi:leucyl-tRNA synthetase
MPVDQYIGGIEHAILHLLYSRYFTRVLNDFDLVSYKEPFTRVPTQGMVCKETSKCPQHGFLYPEEVIAEQGGGTCQRCGSPVKIGRIEKMSKSKKNVVDPNALIEKYGADTLRLFCLFAAPPERDLDWSDQAVEGAYRFLKRVWRLVAEHEGIIKNAKWAEDDQALSGELKTLHRKTHQTIKRASKDIEDRFHFNTAISAVMELVNTLQAVKDDVLVTQDGPSVMRFAVETVILLLSPMVPHFSEELWEALGNSGSVLDVPWPDYREEATEEEERLIVVQVNGKVRSRFNAGANEDDETIQAAALADERVVARIGERPVRKVIVVKGKLVNIVV